MPNLLIEISPEVFQRFPGYVRGVVVAHGVKNGPSPADLVARLRQAEEGLRGRLTLEHLTEEPRIQAWREAYRAFGAKPSEFRASIEAMTRRALRGDPLPSISALVDIGNIVSLNHLLTVGGHAIDRLHEGMRLRMASGTEIFTAFGSNQPEHPLPGEIIFADGDDVMTRRWTWRQANHTLVTPETTDIEINVDGLPPVPLAEVEAAGQEVMDLVQQYCGGTLRFEILSTSHPVMQLFEAK